MGKNKPSRKSTIPLDKNGSKPPASQPNGAGKSSTVKRVPRHQGR